MNSADDISRKIERLFLYFRLLEKVWLELDEVPQALSDRIESVRDELLGLGYRYHRPDIAATKTGEEKCTQPS